MGGLFGGFVVLAANFPAMPAVAAPQQVHLSIPEQAATSGLPEFARQTNLTISAPAAALQGRRIPALRGHMDLNRALDRILQSTGLEIASRQGPIIALRRAHVAAAIQPSEPVVARVDDVVVTALHHDATVQSLPASITAVTGRTLEARGLQDSGRLGQVAIGLTIREAANGGTRVTLRNIQGAGESTVGLYYDETPIEGSPGLASDPGGSVPEIRLFDVERAEVLRGPQGTLYGAGSMAGTVRLIFRKPDATLLSGETSARAGRVEDGGATSQAQGMLNLPLLRDVLAVRAVAFERRRGGFLDNSRLGGSDFNTLESRGGRLSLRYTPMDRMTLDIAAAAQDTRTYNNNWYYKTFDAGGSARDASYASYQPQVDDYRTLSATGRWQDENFVITAIASSSRRRLVYTYDAGEQARNLSLTNTSTAQCRAYFGLGDRACSPAQVTAFQAFAASHAPASLYSPSLTETSTQELRFTSRQGASHIWTAGLFHSRRRATINSGIYRVDPRSGLIRLNLPRSASAVRDIRDPDDVFMLRTIDDDLEQFAAYGEGVYPISPAVALTLGARYYRYDKSVAGQVLIEDVLSSVEPAPFRSTASREDGWLLKANLAWQVRENVLGYVQAAQGFRPGGVNQVVGLPPDLESYGSDSLWNYEMGVKGSWMDRRLTLNIDLFQIDWRDMQVRATTDANGSDNRYGYITNVGFARVRGLEAEAVFRPTPELEVRLAGARIEAVLTRDQVTEGATVNGAGMKGDFIPYTPRLTALAGADYARETGRGLRFTAGLDVSYHGETWTAFRRTDAFSQQIPSFTNIDARVGLENVAAGWAISLYGLNLTDAVGIQVKSSGPLFGGSDQVRAVGLTPRILGVELRQRF